MLDFLNPNARSQPIDVDGHKVVFKVLTPGEWLEVWETSHKYQSPSAKALSNQIESLARTIVTIDGGSLVLDPSERDAVKKRLNRAELTSVEEASLLLQDRFMIHTIQMLDVAAGQWMDQYFKDLEAVKKSPNAAGLGGGISTSAEDSTSSPPTSGSSV